MDYQQLERALEGNGGDFGLDSLIRSLSGLQIEPATQITAPNAAGENLPKNVAEWAEVVVREVLSASDMNDGKCRAARVLEAMENSVSARANIYAERRIATLTQLSTFLMNAVAIKDRRNKQCEERIAGLERLVSEFEDQMEVRIWKSY